MWGLPTTMVSSPTTDAVEDQVTLMLWNPVVTAYLMDTLFGAIILNLWVSIFSCWLILTVVIAHRQCDIDNIVKRLIKLELII